MLRFILGTAQSGKTYAAFSRIRDHLEKGGKEAWLLVPEQASFAAEKELIRSLGVALANRVRVVSFTRLCHTVLADTGGLSLRVADEGTRLLLMGQALSAVKNDLTVYGKVAEHPSFAAGLLKDMNELKQSALTAESLAETAEKVTSSALQGKLRDVAKVMAAYESLLEGRFLDPQDVNGLAARLAAERGWFRDRMLVADGFTGFTRSQYQLLEPAVRDGRETVFCFTCDGPDPTAGVDLFANIRSEIAVLSALAGKYGVETETDPVLTGSRAAGEGLSALERTLRGDRAPAGEERPAAPAVTLCACETPEDEAAYAASVIRRAVRETGARWRDFVIVTGKDAHYEQTVASALRRGGVPCFLSRNTPLTSLPLARFVLAALGVCAGHFRTEDVMRYLKSGLSGLTDPEVDRLETYVYVWSLSGKDWLHDWTMPPAGLAEDRTPPEEIAARLDELNQLRRRAVEPLRRLSDAAHGTVNDLVLALFRFLEGAGIGKRLEEYAAWLMEQNDAEHAALQSASWNAVMTVLDRLTHCIGDKPSDAAAFSRLLEDCFAGETVGEIPQRADEVIFGTADRLRPVRPKTVLILGAGEGVFPAGISTGGLFTLAEREALTAAGAVLPDRRMAAAVEQQYLFYTTACSASDAVYITYPGGTAGAKRQPSLPVRTVRAALAVNETTCSRRDRRAEELETPAEAFRYLAVSQNDPDPATESVRSALNMRAEYRDKLSLLGGLCPSFDSLSREAAKGLYSDTLRLSPSRIETYFRCPFSYFLRYGLNASTVRPAGLDSAVRGTVAHYVLETVLKDYRGRYPELTADTAVSAIETAVAAYFDLLGVDPACLPLASRLSLDGLKANLKDVLCFLAEDFSVNRFSPERFELQIDTYTGAELPALTLSKGNTTVRVIGKVDRVDVFRDGDTAHIRIADYKTGHKTFQLADTLCGQNLQMLLYLCAVVENGEPLFGKTEPAAILYVPAAPAPEEETQQKDTENEDGETERKNEFGLAVNGLFTRDRSVLGAMGVEADRRYVPIRLTKKDEAHGGDAVVDTENFRTIFRFVKEKALQMAEEVLAGNIAVDPVDSSTDACKYCEFRPVCRREKTEENRLSPYKGLSRKTAMETIQAEVETNEA